MGERKFDWSEPDDAMRQLVIDNARLNGTDLETAARNVAAYFTEPAIPTGHGLCIGPDVEGEPAGNFAILDDGTRVVFDTAADLVAFLQREN